MAGASTPSSRSIFRTRARRPTPRLRRCRQRFSASSKRFRRRPATAGTAAPQAPPKSRRGPSRTRLRRAARPPKVAVMGGSLGGLTAALVLRDAGCDVDVYERSEAPLQDRGAGIVLHPATVRYLVENQIRAASEIGVPARCLRYLARDDGLASESPSGLRFTSYYALYRD